MVECQLPKLKVASSILVARSKILRKINKVSGELFELRWCDVDFEEGVIKNITSYKGKTVQRREVPLTARLRSTLLDLKQKRGAASGDASQI